MTPTSFDSLRRDAAFQATLGPKTLRLAIAGGDFLLRGRFSHWLPLAVEGASAAFQALPGEERTAESAVQLFIDTTAAVSESATDVEDLFSFEATDVKPLAELAVVAQGTLRSGGVALPAQLVLQTPAVHTPFIVATLSLDPRSFPEVWGELTTLVSIRRTSDTQVQPHAWLRAPELATA